MEHSRSLKIVGILSIAVTLVVLTCTNLHDLDHGFYLAVGRWMIEHHALPRNEFYLPLLSDHPFASPWLLSALIFAAVWDGVGVAGFIALKALCYAGAFSLAAIAATRRGVPVVVACLCAALAACAVANRLVERPGFFSALFYGVIIAAIPPGSAPSRRLLSALIALLIIWPFLHAEWYVGLLLFACLMLTTKLSPPQKTIIIILSAVLPAIVFAVIHPAHFAPLVAPFRFVGGGGADFKISEYSAATWSQMPGAIPLLLLLAVMAGSLLKEKRHAESLLLMVLIGLSVKMSRAALPALLIGTPWLAQGTAWLLSRVPRAQSVTAYVLCAAAPLWAVAWIHSTPYRNFGFHIDPMIDTRGVGEIFQRINGTEGTVLAEYGYTSQLLSNPAIVRQGVLMDGRQEVYSTEYFQTTYLDCVFQRGEKQAAALERARVAFYAEAWREAGGTDLFPALRAQGWEIIGWDNSGRVLARPGIAAKHGLHVYRVDPANVQELQNRKREELVSALEEIRVRNAELLGENLPATIPLCAQAALELATGDAAGAAESLEKSRVQGGERISSYWRTKLALATVKDDFPAMRDAVREMERRGFK